MVFPRANMLNIKLDNSLVLASASITAAFVGWKVFNRYKHPLPPGPRGWPLVGCIGVLSPDMYYQLENFGHKYGNVFSMYIGSKLTVVLNDYEAIRAAFVDQNITFAGRPYPWVMKLVGIQEEINNGTYSEEWLNNRKELLMAMRKFGFGTGGIDRKIQEQILSLMDIYHYMKKAAFNPRDHIRKAMAKLVFSILIDEHDDGNLQEKLDLISNWQTTVAKANILDIFPLLRFLPFKPIQSLRMVAKQMKIIYGKNIEEHIQNYRDDELKDVIDVYLQKHGLDCDKEKLIGIFPSVVGDTVESLPEQMVWILLYLAHFKDIQRNLQQALDKIVNGTDVSLEHRSQLVCVEAFIMESLRMSSFVPITEPHSTLQDTYLCGYYIPKGSNVLGNLYAAHMDTSFWDNPQDFSIERFIDPNGKLVKPDAYMPFGIGRRLCLGEPLAMKVMFLYVASIIQRYTVIFDPQAPEPSLVPPVNYNRIAEDFKICAIPR